MYAYIYIYNMYIYYMYIYIYVYEFMYMYVCTDIYTGTYTSWMYIKQRIVCFTSVNTEKHLMAHVPVLLGLMAAILVLWRSSYVWASQPGSAQILGKARRRWPSPELAARCTG